MRNARDHILTVAGATGQMHELSVGARSPGGDRDRPKWSDETPTYPGPIGDANLVMLIAGSERFTLADLYEISDLVARIWTSAADRDWSARAGTLEWSCLRTADHAVDCVYAPGFFLASRRTDAYPEAGQTLEFGSEATPTRIVGSLELATRILAAVVQDTDPDTQAIIFRRPAVVLGRPVDFIPRGAMELILHGHDVCSGLDVPFEPPRALAYRLAAHTRCWPMWGASWKVLADTDDPWGDLLAATGRQRYE